MDKVWHEGLLYKLKSFGISWNLLNLIKHYLTDRSQRVLLNGQCSNWQPILVGVSQGSILGPLFFLTYIDDLPDGLNSNVKLFADDTAIFWVVKNKKASDRDLSNDLDMISKWVYNWKTSFNPDPKNPRKRYYSLEKTRIQLIQLFLSTMFRYKDVINKSL